MRSTPIFGRLFSWFLLLLAAVIGIVGLSFAIGARSSLIAWESRLAERLQRRVRLELAELADSRGIMPLGVERALRGLLGPGVFVRVYDGAGNLILSFQNGALFAPASERMPRMRNPGFPQARRAPGPPAGLPQTLTPGQLDRLERVPTDPSQPARFYFHARSEGFLTDEPNRIFFRSILLALAVGAVAAAVLASLAAVVLGKTLSRSTTAISGALSRIASGDRSVTVRRGRTRELNQIADAAEQLQVDLSRQEQLRKQWAQDVAHDLRTPVAALLAQLEAVRDGVLPATPERTEQMLEQIGRIASLVGNLSELTRVESPQSRLDCRSWEGEHLAGELVSLCTGLLSAGENQQVTSSHNVVVVSARGQLMVDLNLVTRAVANLVDNAVKYRVAETPIDCEITAGSHGLAVTVGNRGNLPDHPELLFDRLVRGEASRSTAGTGLGLTIARAIAKRHGGDVRLVQVDHDRVEARFIITGCSQPAG